METRPYCDEDFIVLVEMALSCQDALIPEFRGPKKKTSPGRIRKCPAIRLFMTGSNWFVQDAAYAEMRYGPSHIPCLFLMTFERFWVHWETGLDIHLHGSVAIASVMLAYAQAVGGALS